MRLDEIQWKSREDRPVHHFEYVDLAMPCGGNLYVERCYDLSEYTILPYYKRDMRWEDYTHRDSTHSHLDALDAQAIIYHYLGLGE